MDYVINTTTDQIHSTGGIALAGKILEKINFGYVEGLSIASHPSVLKSLIGLMVQGRTSFEEMRLFRNDSFFKDSFNLGSVYAAETVRIYLDRMADEGHLINTAAVKSNIRLLKYTTLTPIQTESDSYIPVDIDTSPLDNSKSHKEGVGRTYKGYFGYHPIFCYLGQEGYMLDCELREGQQHCQKGTPEFLEQVLNSIEQLNLNHSRLFRLDGGFDSKETLMMLIKSNHYFIVKRNLRKESPEYWLQIARAEGDIVHQDDKKIVYRGFHTGKKPAGDESFPEMDIVFQVTLKLVDKEDRPLLFPEIEVETFWTNMHESPETVIELYHDHGTSEQFHSELKTDMNFERLPSGKFAVNSILLKLAMIAFNILRFIGQTALKLKRCLPYPTKVLRKRLRKVIDDLIRIAVKVASHARQKILRLWCHDPWFECFQKIYKICCNL